MGYSLKNEFKVGVFVLVGLSILLMSILLLGGDRMFLTSRYQLRVQFDNVQGINKGSIVSLSGIAVGNIQDVRFFGNSSAVELILDIDKSFKDKITEGSVASIKTQGALGDKYVYIKPGPPEAKAIAKDGLLPSDQSPDLFDAIAQKGDELTQVSDIIKEVRVLLGEINSEGRSALLMRNLVDSSGHLKSLLGDTRSLVGAMNEGEKNKLAQSLTHLSSILKKIDEGRGTLGALVNDPSLHQRLMMMLGETPRNRYLGPMIRESIRSSENDSQ